MPPDLKQCRSLIDKLDQKILQGLNERAKLVLEIGRIKQSSSTQVYDPHRETKVLESLVKANQEHGGIFPDHAVRTVFREIMSACRILQSPVTVAYLGPEATFTHLAALKYFGHSTELAPQTSIAKVFDAIEKELAHCGIVPIENTTEGVVGATLDRFMDSPLQIVGETILPVHHHLLSRVKMQEIRKVYSHPQALAQCRHWLEQNLPQVPVFEVESTAMAAQKAAQEKNVAGVAGEHAAEIYGLNLLKRNIEDNPNNRTRFLVLGNKSPAKTGQDKTSVLFSVKDEVGILYRMLEPFYKRKINLTKIESRPLKKKAWEYIFFVDIDGHETDKKVGEALQELKKRCVFLKILGSYPKALV